MLADAVIAYAAVASTMAPAIHDFNGLRMFASAISAFTAVAVVPAPAVLPSAVLTDAVIAYAAVTGTMAPAVHVFKWPPYVGLCSFGLYSCSSCAGPCSVGLSGAG